MRGGQSGCAFAASLLLLVHAGCFERGGKASRDRAAAEGDGGSAVRAPAVAAATEPTGPVDADATISVRLEAEPAHLNPLLAGDALAARVALGDIYEGLLCTDRPGAEARECLAEKVGVDARETTWRFTLRNGVRWHDGRPLTTGDVRFTFELLRDREASVSWLSADFDDMTGIHVVSEREIAVRFAGFRVGRREAFARVPILPRHIFAGDPAGLLANPANRRPVGSGPLRFVTWKSGETILLERFADYWGRPARARRIEYRVLPNRQQMANALSAGKLDVAVQIPIEEALDLAARHRDLEVFTYQRPAYLAAVYNLRRPALVAARARRALTMLLDRGTLAEKLFRNYAQVISGPFLPGSPGEDVTVKALGFDPEAAGRLLGETARESTITLTVLTPAGSRTMARIADIWAEDARPHARLAIEPIAYADLLGRVREGRFDAALMGFTTARDLDLYTRFHSSQVGGENYGALEDAELDRVLEAVRAEPDAQQRARLQRAVHRRVHELQPYSFIVSDARLGLARQGVGGVRDGAGFSARFLWRERRK